jgi:hypothetical protein
MRNIRIELAILAVLALAACAPGDPGNGGNNNGDDDTSMHPDADPNAGFIDAAPFIDAGGFFDGGSQQNGACDKIDILFVVDDSASMEDEQAALTAAFPQFVSIIENYTTSAGTHLDYHVGVTSTDHGDGLGPGDDGQLFNTSNTGGQSCMFAGGRRYLQRGDTNVSTAFSCAASLGAQGSGFEMELQGAKMALVDRMTGSQATNQGFRREDALLAIVMLTDENDCSTLGSPGFFDLPQTYCDMNLVPTHDYVTAFDAVKGGERGRWATAIIAIPPGAGSCAGTGSSENVRLKAFADEVGANAVFSNLCSGNMPQALKDAFDTFSTACENIPPVN